MYEADGAMWIRSTDFGDDKDRVYVGSNGEFAYFAADCAYYLDKRPRGADKVIIILGADHPGYVGRMRDVAACSGDVPDQTLEILIGQMVNPIRDGQPLRMSKRPGPSSPSTTSSTRSGWTPLVTHRRDTRSTPPSISTWTSGPLDPTQRRQPVYYVQYARITSLLRHAAEAGIMRATGTTPACWLTTGRTPC